MRIATSMQIQRLATLMKIECLMNQVTFLVLCQLELAMFQAKQMVCGLLHELFARTKD